MPENNLTQISLFILVIAAAFFIGTLFTKVQNLEKTSQLSSDKVAVLPANTANLNNAVDNNQLAATPKPAQAPAVTPEDYIQGDKNALVTLIEYADLECPFCKQFHPTMQQILKEYQGKVRWVYRHYPLPFHANAQKEAEAAECAGKLGGNQAFWKYIDSIYERTTGNGTGFSLDKLTPLAKEIGVNQAGFQKCLDSGEFSQKVKDQMQQGSQAGVAGTPATFLIDSQGETQFINGALPFDQIKPMIEQVLTN